MLKPLEKIQVACDNTGIIMLSVLGVLTLGVCFFGYRIYKLAFPVFGFLVGFGLQAAVGSAWVQQQDNQDHGITVKIIVVVCAILWGTLFLMLARRYYEVIQKVLGFLVGVCLGVAITILAVSLAEKPLEENLAQYAGWERFAAVTLGVPIALLTGYVCRNFVKYLIMLLTAVVGAAGLWKCGTSLIDCPQVHSDLGPGLLENPVFNWSIFIGLSLVGLLAQFLWQPKSTGAKSSATVSPRGEP